MGRRFRSSPAARTVPFPRSVVHRVTPRRSAIFVAISVLFLMSACGPAEDPGADGVFLSEGDQAPNFTLPSASGDEVQLRDFRNQKSVLLYFSMGPG